MVKKLTDLATLTTADANDVVLAVDVSANTSKQLPISGIGAGLGSKTVALTSVNGGTTAGALQTDSSGNISAVGAWQTWSPTLGGFSANPTGTYYYTQIGKLVVLSIAQSTNGTSNSALFTISLPVTAATRAGHVWEMPCQVVDNGASLIGVANVTSAGTTLNLYKDAGGNAFTASGNKRTLGMTFMYEAA